MEMILDYVQDHQVTVYTCSLVSKACISHTRRHLFQAIVLDSPATFSIFESILLSVLSQQESAVWILANQGRE